MDRLAVGETGIGQGKAPSMRPSIRLGTLFGIPIGLHWSIAVIVGLVTFGLAGTILPQAAAGYASAVYLAAGLAVAAGLLASIVAHELGHALFDLRDEYTEFGRSVQFGYPNCAFGDGQANAWWGTQVGQLDPFALE